MATLNLEFSLPDLDFKREHGTFETIDESIFIEAHLVSSQRSEDQMILPLKFE